MSVQEPLTRPELESISKHVAYRHLGRSCYSGEYLFLAFVAGIVFAAGLVYVIGATV